MPPRRRSSSAPAPSAPSPSSAPASVSASLLHALQPWPVVVYIAGRFYEVPAEPASLWVAQLAGEEGIVGVLNLLDDTDLETINDDILLGELNLTELNTVLTELVTLVSGRPWWFTMRLIHAAQDSWDAIGGYLALKGIRADQLSFQAWMDALLATVLRHIQPDKHVSWLARMKAPPVGTKVVFDEKREEDLFRAQMGGQ